MTSFRHTCPGVGKHASGVRVCPVCHKQSPIRIDGTYGKHYISTLRFNQYEMGRAWAAKRGAAK